MQGKIDGDTDIPLLPSPRYTLADFGLSHLQESVQGKIDGDTDTPLLPSPRSTLADFELSHSQESVHEKIDGDTDTPLLPSPRSTLTDFEHSHSQMVEKDDHVPHLPLPISTLTERGIKASRTRESVQGKSTGDTDMPLLPSPTSTLADFGLSHLQVVEKDDHVSHLPLLISTLTERGIKPSHTRESVQGKINGDNDMPFLPSPTCKSTLADYGLSHLQVVEKDYHVPHLPLPISTLSEHGIKPAHTRDEESIKESHIPTLPPAMGTSVEQQQHPQTGESASISDIESVQDICDNDDIPPLPPPLPIVTALLNDITQTRGRYSSTTKQMSSISEPLLTTQEKGTKRKAKHGAHARDAVLRKRRRVSQESKAGERYDVEAHIPQQKEPPTWIPELKLTTHHREILATPHRWLDDILIDAGQHLLKKQFGAIGLQSVVLLRCLAVDVQQGEFVQVLNKGNYHWFTISTIGCKHGVVRVYDSASHYVTGRNRQEIAALVCANTKSITLEYMNVHLQGGGSDCGLFALAFATSLCNSDDPTRHLYMQHAMRAHLVAAFETGKLEGFPISRSCRSNLKPVKSEEFRVYCTCRQPYSGDDMIECSCCKSGTMIHVKLYQKACGIPESIGLAPSARTHS